MKALTGLALIAALAACQTTSQTDFNRALHEAHMRCGAYDLEGAVYDQCVMLTAEELYQQFSYERQATYNRLALTGGALLLMSQ